MALALVVMVSVPLTRVVRRDRLAVAPVASAVWICTQWFDLTAGKTGA